MDTTLLQSAGAMAGGGVALIGALTILVRRLSRDRNELTKDRVELDYLAQLLKERNDALMAARDALRERYDDSKVVARLTVENEFQAKELARLADDFAHFKRQLGRMYPQTRRFVESDFADDSLLDDHHGPLPTGDLR